MSQVMQAYESPRDTQAQVISFYWDLWHKQRYPKIEEWIELVNYLFATDTSTTSNRNTGDKDLSFRNTTILPKLCQIKDNIHANYSAGLFPNSNWLDWEALERGELVYKKSKAIKGYMTNKCKMSGFTREIDKCVDDYIIYGSAFATCDYMADVRDDVDNDGQFRRKINYIGPKARRIDPISIVFNPTAPSFDESPKIIRSLYTEGDMLAIAKKNASKAFFEDAVKNKKDLQQWVGSIGYEDFPLSEHYANDGFGSLKEYLERDTIEILEFYGDYYDRITGELETDMVITVANRCKVIRKEKWRNSGGYAPIRMVSWRNRPGNLWGMGPLDNLIGCQHRLDQMENAKADAIDIALASPIVFKGNVERMGEWGPYHEIYLDQDGDVQELARNVQWVLAAENDSSLLEERMELYAGAPKEAMGVRTPGEKTAFEVEQLNNASWRIFQQKITQFETQLLEPLLNDMFDLALEFMDTTETIRVTDEDTGREILQIISPDDIKANGIIRPIGARHFGEKANLLKNISTVFASPGLMQCLRPHISGKHLGEFINDTLGIEQYQIILPNVAVFEEAETQELAMQVQEDIATTQDMVANAPAQVPGMYGAPVMPTQQEDIAVPDSGEMDVM